MLCDCFGVNYVSSVKLTNQYAVVSEKEIHAALHQKEPEDHIYYFETIKGLLFRSSLFDVHLNGCGVTSGKHVSKDTA
jgi:hypothetical protein